jgi:hypothetical protein
MNVLMIVLSLIPALIQAIKAIEAAIPESGKGAEKLEAVKNILEVVDANASKYWPQIQSVVSILVGLFNKTGTFSKAE